MHTIMNLTDLKRFQQKILVTYTECLKVMSAQYGWQYIQGDLKVTLSFLTYLLIIILTINKLLAF